MKIYDNSKAFFLFFLIIVVFASCNKINETVPWTKVEGIVKDYNSSKPIVNVQISVNKITEVSEYQYKSEIIATFMTNENGEYSCQFHAKTDGKNSISYSLTASKSSEGYGTGEYQQITKGKKNYNILKLCSIGYLTVHIKNQNPYDNSDEICVCAVHPSFQTEASSCETPPSSYWCKYGTDIDEDFFNNVQSLFGNNYQVIKWWVTKNNVTTSFKDSIFINPCVNNTFTINY